MCRRGRGVGGIIALDTNVLVRYLVDSDAEQVRAARRAHPSAPLYTFDRKTARLEGMVRCCWGCRRHERERSG